jgi:23S rRNA (adenine2503-C2)-methyltransferase
MAAKPNIRSLSQEELSSFFTERGEPAFRAKQVHQWLWQKHVRSFDEMSNVAKPLRAFLESHFELLHLHPKTVQKSSDGTVKSALSLHDGKVVESVLIPKGKRMTACISSQVGCSLDCSFCATARLKMARNLMPDEIYDQVVEVGRQAQEHFQTPLTNIVFMGMGEPLLNYKNVISAIERITHPEGLGMSPRRITLSTSGIAKMIWKMGEDGVRFRLALSLHAATDEKRSRLMSINDSNSLDMLSDAVAGFYQATGNRITYEYVLLRDFNDSDDDARALERFCRRVPCRVNLIEYNPIEGGEFKASSSARTNEFIGILERAGVRVSLRRSRGKDIDAACGQLANKP